MGTGSSSRRSPRARFAFVLATLWLLGAACSSSTARTADEAAPAIDGAPSGTTTPRSTDDPTTTSDPSATATDDPTGGDNTTAQPSRDGGTGTAGEGASDGGAATAPDTGSGGGDGTQEETPAASEAPETGTGEPFVLGIAAASNNAMSQVGVSIDPPTDQRSRRWIEALRDHINDNGGVGGRPLETVIRFVDQSDQSEANQTRLQTQVCAEFTEDLKVDMVVGEATAWVLECYAQHETPLFNPVVTRDQQQLDPVRPWVLPSFFLTWDRFAKLMPISLAQQDWISDSMGVFTFDLPWYERAVMDHLIPGIEAQGGKVLEVARSPVSVDAVSAAAQSAAVKFKSRDIDRVIIFANGGGAYLLFAQAADQQLYYPGYGLSTLDRPWVFTDLVPPAQRNVRGFGFWPTLDVDPESQPPPGEGELECWDILNERAGENFQFRNLDSQLASATCDLMFLIDAGLDRGTGRPFGPRDVPSLFAELKDDYQSITVDTVDFTRGRYDAVSVYRNLTYDVACACVRYTSDATRIPFD